MGVIADLAVVSVEGRFEQEDGGNSPRHFLHVADFFLGEGAAQNILLAIGEELLDDLIASECPSMRNPSGGAPATC